MATFNIATSEILVDKNIYGGKAHWLSWLIVNNFKVPFTFFLSASNKSDFQEFGYFLQKDETFISLLRHFEISTNKFEIAVRSSALSEDSSEMSYAGHFKSFLETTSLDTIFKNIESVIDSGESNSLTGGQKMGIVLQRKINSRLSGIAFSSNPLTGFKNELLISMVEGMGEKLASGKTSGENILITYTTGKAEIPIYNTKIEEKYLLELCNILKSIEGKTNFPVDVEWCIDNETNQLYILQCRPITAMFPKQTGILPIKLKNKLLIPNQVKENDKVKIRLIAEKNSIDISNAYLVINSNSSIIDESMLSKIQPETRCNGYSVVLLFPKSISGNIIRHFAEKEVARQNSAFRTCQRYDIRSYQNHGNLIEILKSIQEKCGEISWFSVAIIQEIFEPTFTGIAKKIRDGFLIEIAKGHFIPKGVVPTSQYVLSNEHKLLFKTEVIQEYSYKISHGTVSKESVNTPVIIEENTLSRIIDSLSPVLATGEQAVEFGLLENETTKLLTPYLIDLVDDNSKTELNSKLITEGVISIGKRSGKARILDTSSLSGNSLELHFHNQFENQKTNDKEIIFIAETPDIALLEVVRYNNEDKIGFIFKEGSALSHFSIILREKGIPAIVLNQNMNIQEMEQINIDASTQGLRPNERLSREAGCVTTYTNPDTDGIGSALAYSYYMKSKGKRTMPLYFGNLDKETMFVLNKFKIDYPQQVSSAKTFREIILVDTHHIAQLSKEIPFDNVVEIIDHHPGGNPESFPNAKIQNEEVGAACTLIAERMKNENIIPDKDIAGVMALAIISNTLNFTAPSSSRKDKDMLNWIETITKIPDDLIKQMFDARSDVSGISSEKIIQDSLKEFNWGKVKFGISQVEMTDIKTIIERPDFITALLSVKTHLNLDYVLFTGVNILKHSTTILCPDEETLKIVNEGMKFSSPQKIFEVDKILLRKTDFIPSLKKYFDN